MEAGLLEQPLLEAGGLVSGVAVQDQVQVRLGRGCLVNGAQENAGIPGGGPCARGAVRAWGHVPNDLTASRERPRLTTTPRRSRPVATNVGRHGAAAPRVWSRVADHR